MLGNGEMMCPKYFDAEDLLIHRQKNRCFSLFTFHGCKYVIHRQKGNLKREHITTAV